MNVDIWSILASVLTLLSGGAIFKYYDRRAKRREKNDDFIKNDCKERILKLEKKLDIALAEKEELNALVLRLTKRITELETRIEFLTKEKNRLSSRKNNKQE